MTVRDKAGRRRYILFEVESETDSGMGRIINRFRQRLPEVGLDGREIRFRVIHFGDGIGIVRCSHLARDQVTEMINTTQLSGVPLRTLRTSGTLKTLKVWLRDNRGIKVPGKTIQRKKKKTHTARTPPTPPSKKP